MRMFFPSFQPVDRHGRTQVSGSAPSGNGPSLRNRSSTSLRQTSLSSSQSRSRKCHSSHGPGLGQAVISARYRATSSTGRRAPPTSTMCWAATASPRSPGLYLSPSLHHSTSSAAGATARVWSRGSIVSRRAASSTSTGRSWARRAARTASRRAWSRVTVCAVAVIMGSTVSWKPDAYLPDLSPSPRRADGRRRCRNGARSRAPRSRRSHPGAPRVTHTFASGGRGRG